MTRSREESSQGSKFYFSVKGGGGGGKSNSKGNSLRERERPFGTKGRGGEGTKLNFSRKVTETSQKKDSIQKQKLQPKGNQIQRVVGTHLSKISS